jgi:hypothetical protein
VGRGVAEVLTYAVGVAVSPLPIIAVILVLFSRQGQANGRAFLAGWIMGLAVVSGVAYAVAAGANASSDTTASDGVSWLKIALGVVFLWMAARQWRTRPVPGAAPERPKWMGRIDAMTAGQAASLGAILVVANPKNLILTIGAATGLAQLGLSSGDVVVALIVFIVVASASIAAPVIYSRRGGARAEAALDDAKAWLGENNATIMAVLFLVFGVDLIATGIGALS